jgi:GT2 family glycosyltransferase
VPRATVIESGGNLGYGGGNNLGAQRASGELLVFLNPDAVAQPGFRDAIAAPLEDGSHWGAWQGLVTAEGGRTINTRGGVVHFTGLAWAGGAGEPRADAETAGGEPGFASGACLAIPRETFAALGGFAEKFFLYHEDVDLSLRVRLAGGELGVATKAVVDHAYDFDKGSAKWRYLERNRWATVIRTYPGPLLALVFPALLATDLALWPVALLNGWGRQRLLAFTDFIRSLPRLVGERRRIRKSRAVGAGEFARHLTPALDSTYLGRAGRSHTLAALLRAYWSVVLRLLGA